MDTSRRPTGTSAGTWWMTNEFQILVHPVVLGQGRPVFEGSGVRTDLRLEGTRTFGNGVVLLHYSSDGA